MSETVSFTEEIEANKNATEVSSQVARVETPLSALAVRLRGGYITYCDLTSAKTGDRVPVLYSEENLEKPKLSATHTMLPAGPYDGVGGQHGFPRWSEYHEFLCIDGSNGERQMALQAMRSDTGLSLAKSFELTDSALTIRTTTRNSTDTTERTSMGEHLYFALADERLDGLKVNDQSLNVLLGDNSEDKLRAGSTLYMAFDKAVDIAFPAGHTLRLSAEFEGDSAYPLGMWIWKRPGSPSICFEPVAGVKYLDEDSTDGVKVPPYGNTTLSTKIELV